MRVTAISDFHGILPEIEETDLLLICGDISPFQIQFNKDEMEDWFKTTFANWVENLNCKKIIMTPGNHDAYLENKKTEKKRDEFHSIFKDKLVCLWNQYYELNLLGETLKIFGTPYCHQYGTWPFMRTAITLKEKFEIIPEGLDILITHDPVYNLGSTDVILKPKTLQQSHFKHLGNVELKEHLYSLHEFPKYIFCGHIHSGEHDLHYNEHLNCYFANVGLMDEYCDSLVYKPLKLEIDGYK